MRWMYWLPGALLFTAPVALAQTPEAASPRSFTATLVTLSKGGKESSIQKRIDVRGDLLHFRSGDEPMGILFDFGQGKVWTLLPQEKVAIESKLTRSLDTPLSLMLTDASGNPCGKEPALTCTREGEEPIAGRPAVKWRLVHTGKDKKMRTETAWVDPKLGVMVRHTSEEGGTMELRNLQEGPVDEALVQFPAGFQTVSEKELHHDSEPEPAPKPKKKTPGKKP